MRDTRWLKESSDVRSNRAHVVWLTLGMVVSLGITFALGFGVGKRAERIGQTPMDANKLARIDTDKKNHDKFTFYDQLTKPRRAPGAVTKKQATSIQVAPTPKTFTPADDKKKSGQPPTPPSQAVVHRNPAVTAPIATKQQSPRAIDDGPAHHGDYTVQVSSFQSASEARAFSSGLRRKGYKPFVVSTDIRGRGRWHRVRLGRFTNEAAAIFAKHKLAAADIPAWVLRTE